jgi:hypothetical protein
MKRAEAASVVRCSFLIGFLRAKRLLTGNKKPGLYSTLLYSLIAASLLITAMRISLFVFDPLFSTDE